MHLLKFDSQLTLITTVEFGKKCFMGIQIVRICENGINAIRLVFLGHLISRARQSVLSLELFVLFLFVGSSFSM